MDPQEEFLGGGWSAGIAGKTVADIQGGTMNVKAEEYSDTDQGSTTVCNSPSDMDQGSTTACSTPTVTVGYKSGTSLTVGARTQG